MLFNRSGYVLNFSTNDLDVFTTNSIGEALCAKYGLSKGKSLIAYLNSASDENRFKLLSDLFHYYEENMEYEYNENYEDDLYWGSGVSRYDERYQESRVNGFYAVNESNKCYWTCKRAYRELL